MDKFDLKKFLIENRLRAASSLTEMQIAIDEDLFQLWDQYVDDNREGMSKVETPQGTGFYFEQDAPGFREFISAAILELLNNDIHFSYNPVRSVLKIHS